jgi:hypothetical protein
MSRDDIQKLLGGYATDTLSEEERRALFAAALDDQELFDTLAKEQALRDVLQDPSARQQLIDALGPAREPFAARAWRRLRQPPVLAMAGGLAVLLIVGGLVLRQTKRAARPVAIMADAIAPRNELSTAASQSVPSAAPRTVFHPPAARIPKPSPLPAPPILPAQREISSANLSVVPATAPPPPPAVALARSAPAGAAEGGRQMLPAMPMPTHSFIASGGARMARMSPAKAKASGASVAATRPIEYTLLLKDDKGVYSQVPSGTVFRAGDSVRLQVEARQTGYIYLLQRDSTGVWNLVASQPVETAQRYELPSSDGLESDTAAHLELLLVLSRAEEPAFAVPQTADVDALVSKAQASLNITLEYR